MLRNYKEILTSFGPPKGPKTPKKFPLRHFLATQEAILGDCNFGGENGLQIKKFKLFHNLDSQEFIMSYLVPNLDLGKPSKSSLEKALRTEKMALRT